MVHAKVTEPEKYTRYAQKSRDLIHWVLELNGGQVLGHSEIGLKSKIIYCSK